MPEQASARLLAAATPLRFGRGEVIFRQGDPGNAMFLVVCGRVRMGRPGDSGRENLLTLLGPGDLFGELTLFDPAPRKATARAVAAVDLLSMSADTMRRWLSTEPEAAWHLLRFLARRVRRTNDVVENLLFSDVSRRVARAALDLADRFGRRTVEVLRVDHGLTQEELAHYVGASRESVNRALAEFAARGVVRLESRGLVLTDVDRLRRKAAAG